MMFWNEHAPPHFHVRTKDGMRASINIQTLELLDGNLKRKTLRVVQDWAELHQIELIADWDLCRQDKTPNPIAPWE
jgi:Domain of unknown function (DUF4160)